MLDYSAVSFPTGLYVDAEVDVKGNHEALSPVCGEVHQTYDPTAVHNAPISLQLVAQRLEEEKVLAMAARIDEILGEE